MAASSRFIQLKLKRIFRKEIITIIRSEYSMKLFKDLSLILNNYRSKMSTNSKFTTLAIPEIEEKLNSSSIKHRKHPGLRRTGCVKLPEKLVNAAKRIIINKGYNHNQLLDKSKELVNVLKFRKLPVDDRYIKIISEKVEKQICEEEGINLDSLETLQNEQIAKTIRKKVITKLKQIIPHWKPINYDFFHGLLYLSRRLAPEYAILKQVLTEIKYNDPDFTPETLFDFGSGIGSVSWVAHSIWGNYLKEYFSVDTSADMNEIARLLLQDGKENGKMFLNGVFLRQFLPLSDRLKYDLVVSSHSLLDIPSAKERLTLINNLWRKCNKYLVLVDYGTNAAFNAIIEARDYIFHLETKYNEYPKAHVIAPCPHDSSCPRLMDGTNTPCNFEVSYELFPFTKEGNVAKEIYSYVILKKETRPENTASWPRIVREVLKRHKHVVCRMCCSDGKLHEIIFTKSKHGRNLYRCARCSQWGDLIPGSVVPIPKNNS